MPSLLSWLREPVEVQLSLDVPSHWYDWPEGLAPLPKGVIKAKAKAASAAVKMALKSDHGVLLRKDAVASILPAEVLHDVELIVGKKVVSRAFALLEVNFFAPLDRSSSKATWKEHWLDRLAVATWAKDRTPHAKIFRVGEASNEIAIDDTLGVALTAATKKTFGVRPISEAELSQRAVFTHHPDATPPLADPARAEAEYWKAVRNEKPDRKVVCANPAFAYWLASTIDGESRKDTRAGVLEHPVYAALYAAHVLGKPDPMFEQATSGHWWAARFYAHFVSHKLSPAAAKTLKEAGYDPHTEL
jgi:hypothetical protein